MYDAFVATVAGAARSLRQGPALEGPPVDCGAMCLPGLAERVAELVDEAVSHGAQARKHEGIRIQKR